LYIDANGDSIITGQLIVQPMDRPWIAQRNAQESVNYFYFNDTAEFNKYVDPRPLVYQGHQKYFQKHGTLKMRVKENTGGSLSESIFYIHPPRVNQFSMLFYAAHPSVNYKYLQDKVAYGSSSTKIYGFATVVNQHTISPLGKSSMESVQKDVEVWGIYVVSNLEYKKNKEQLPIYNSTLDAEFCKEFGFIKMHYTFENGIKIQMDFVKMTEE
jgi:hypothetical protein